MIKFKEFKKTVAGVMAMAMMFSPVASMVASADNLDVSGGMEDFIAQETYDVVLPTISANTLEFKLDPQGLLSVSAGNNTGYEKYQEGTPVSAGDVVFINKISSNSGYGDFSQSNVIYATNKSSKDVTFKVDVAMTNDATNPVTFVSSNSAVEEDSVSALNLYLAAVPETNAVSWNAVSASDFQAVASTPKDDKAEALDVSGNASLAFKISGNEANYEVKRTVSNGEASYAYVKKADADTTGWESVGFILTGKCNTKADWSAFNDADTELTLGLTWTINEVTGDEDPVASGGYGQIDPASISVNAVEGSGTDGSGSGTGGDNSPSIQGLTAVTGKAYKYETTFTKGTAKTLTINNATVKSCQQGTTVETATATSTNIVTTASTVKIGGNMWSGANSGDVRYIKILLDGKDPIIVKITVS